MSPEISLPATDMTPADATPASLAAMPLGRSTGQSAGAETQNPRPARDLEAVYDIPVLVSAVLGRSTMQVNQLLKLGRGAVVELDRRIGDPIDVFVNNRLIARGEMVMIDDTRLGITMTEIVRSDRNG